MKLIEDLGMQYPTENSKVKAHYGIYECPVCEKHFRYQVNSVDTGHTTKCRRCANIATTSIMSERAKEQFAEVSARVHNNKYDYSLAVYVNDKVKVQIICKDHGVFLQAPTHHKQGKGCPACAKVHTIAKVRENFKDTAASFVSDAAIIHDYKYDYSLVEYINTETKVKIICPEHGIFMQSPHKHKLGRGCPECALTGFDKSKPATLYYLKVVSDDTVVYKIGITNRTVKERFTCSDLLKIEILRTVYFEIGEDAYRKEQEIIKLFKEFRYTGERILSSGNTELFTEDVLASYSMSE